MKFGIFLVAYFTTSSVTGPYIGRSVIKLLSMHFSGGTAKEQMKCVSAADVPVQTRTENIRNLCMQPYRLTQPARFKYADRS
jgi:hypothetical protein